MRKKAEFLVEYLVSRGLRIFSRVKKKNASKGFAQCGVSEYAAIIYCPPIRRKTKKKK